MAGGRFTQIPPPEMQHRDNVFAAVRAGDCDTARNEKDNAIVDMTTTYDHKAQLAKAAEANLRAAMAGQLSGQYRLSPAQYDALTKQFRDTTADRIVVGRAGTIIENDMNATIQGCVPTGAHYQVPPVVHPSGYVHAATAGAASQRPQESRAPASPPALANGETLTDYQKQIERPEFKERFEPILKRGEDALKNNDPNKLRILKDVIRDANAAGLRLNTVTLNTTRPPDQQIGLTKNEQRLQELKQQEGCLSSFSKACGPRSP